MTVSPLLRPSVPDDDSSESGSASGLPALTSPEVLAVSGNPPDGGAPYGEVTENGVSAPLDYSTTSSSSSSEDQQPVNLSDRLLPVGNSPLASYPADPNRKYPVKTEYTNKVRTAASFGPAPIYVAFLMSSLSSLSCVCFNLQ